MIKTEKKNEGRARRPSRSTNPTSTSNTVREAPTRKSVKAEVPEVATPAATNFIAVSKATAGLARGSEIRTVHISVEGKPKATDLEAVAKAFAYLNPGLNVMVTPSGTNCGSI